MGKGFIWSLVLCLSKKLLALWSTPHVCLYKEVVVAL